MSNLIADLQLLADEQRDIASRLRQKTLHLSYGPTLEAYLVSSDEAADKAKEYEAMIQIVAERVKGIA